MKIVTTVAIVLATGFACLAVEPSGGVLRFQKGSADNQLATSTLLTFFRANKIVAEKIGEETLIVKMKTSAGGESPLLVEPKLSTGGEDIDRIVLSSIYKVKWAYKHGDAIKELVWNANRKSNAAQYFIEENGNLQVRMFVTFIDDLSQDELIAALKYIDYLPTVVLPLVDKQWVNYME